MTEINVPDINKYASYLNELINDNPGYKNVCIDRKVLKIHVFEESERDYTWIIFKDANLRLIIPDAYRKFTEASNAPQT